MVLQSPITLLSAVEATGASSAIYPDGAPVTVVISGITTATVAIEGSVDGTNFEAIESKTADACVIVNPSTKFIRANVTAYTSGTITVKAIY
jgi:adenosine/AMP kinase